MGDTSTKYGTGFMIRMAVLLGLLAMVAFGLYYDYNVLQPNAEKTIDEAYKLMVKDTDDGFGVPKDEVQKTIGFEPTEKFTKDDYDIEVYRFRRALPFMQGQYISVAYQNGALYEIVANKEFDPNAKEKLKVHIPSEDERDPMPSSALAGGAPPAASGGGSGDDDSDDDKEKERPAADDSDDSDDSDAEKEESKKDDADKKTEGEKEGDKKADDK